MGWSSVERRAGRRELIIKARAGGGTEHVEGAAPAALDTPALPERAQRNLARLGMRIQRHFGAPQDVEWAWTHGKLYILQALETPFDIKVEVKQPPSENALSIQVIVGEGRPREYQMLRGPALAPARFVDYVGVYQSEELAAPYKCLLNGEQLYFRRGYSTHRYGPLCLGDCAFYLC